MIYEKLRSAIRSGDLVLYRGRGLGAWLIRTWTRSEWSHCGIAWRIGGRVLLLEASPLHGVRAIPMSHRPPDRWLSTTANWTGTVEAVALELLGQPYGWMDAIRAGFGLATSETGGYQCAEYAAAVLSAALPDFKPDVATPQDVALAIIARGLF